MRALIVFIVFLGIQCYGQELPYELERFENSVYESELTRVDSPFTSSENALNYYLLAYKAQRSMTPQEYFPLPNEGRNRAKFFLENQNDLPEAIAIIGFLESSGDLESVRGLNKIELSIDEALPYQFIAAYLLDDTERKHEALRKMKTQNMLSDVLIAFGENLILSSGNQDALLTSGMQDLIAAEYALMIGDAEKYVSNVFASKCTASKQESIETDLFFNQSTILISPAMDSAFYEKYSSDLSLKGIGMIYGSSDPSNSLLNTLNAVSKNFSGLGLEPETPADRGLLKSYAKFYKALQAADKMHWLEGNDDLIKYLKKHS